MWWPSKPAKAAEPQSHGLRLGQIEDRLSALEARDLEARMQQLELMDKIVSKLAGRISKAQEREDKRQADQATKGQRPPWLPAVRAVFNKDGES